MKLNDCVREPRPALLDEFCAEDRELISGHKPRTGDHKEGRKARQLCRQVADTLDLVLSGECRDERLQALRVVSVVPAPNSTRLLVTVFASLPDEEFDRAEILELLERQTARLRREVAASIHRKRVPTLVYHVVGPALEFNP